MSTSQQIGILLSVALLWLLVNIKTANTSVRFVSSVGLLSFMFMASWLAVVAAFKSGAS